MTANLVLNLSNGITLLITIGFVVWLLKDYKRMNEDDEQFSE